LADIVEAALDATRGLLTQQRHEVTIDLPKAPLALFVDFTRLTQVVTNLLQNAAKYTAPGGHISIVATSSSDGTRVELRVSDTGSGMTPELLAHVFDMFAQADDTLDRAHGGMGIGLSLVKKLVELHGGTVEAQSEGKGRGSQLIVRLPCSAPPEISEPAPETPKLPPRRYRVLVVDDNPGITELMTELLVLLGHEAHAASDGVTALAIAATLQPDVIFLDIGLPDMDGHEIARRLRATETTPERNHPLIVAVSGWGQAEDIARSRAAGCDHHFVKPLAMATLEAIVGRVAPRAG
jgi:two-component system CheB/CheR fusion protein